jgi:1-acyl-sn-glycerol-3-phosphate acyltransferase
MKFLAKSKLFQIPIVGWGMFIAGDIPLVRGSATSIKRAMQRAAWYVKRGMPVLIFPEGTRGTGTELLPFKDGAFRLAIDQAADILPIALSGTEDALRKGDWKPSPARGRVLVGNPIPTAGLGHNDLPELKRRAREALSVLVGQIDKSN